MSLSTGPSGYRAPSSAAQKAQNAQNARQAEQYFSELLSYSLDRLRKVMECARALSSPDGMRAKGCALCTTDLGTRSSVPFTCRSQKS